MARQSMLLWVAVVALATALTLAKPNPGSDTVHEAKADAAAAEDSYAAAVEKAQGGAAGEPDQPEAGEHHDGYQGREEYDEQPPLTAEEEMLYADQQPPDWEPYGDNEAEGDSRGKDFDQEYQRYLDELRADMESNPDVAKDLIDSIAQQRAEGVGLSDKDRAVEQLAREFHVESRSRLEEQEREVINRQRREVKHRIHKEEGLTEKAGQFGFNDPTDPFWHDEDVKGSQGKLREVVKNRANLLHNVDTRRRSAFVQHEMERLIEYRELVQRTTDPRVKQALIDAHNAETHALHAAHAAEPGKEKALKEEWEAEGFDPSSFDPKTMFRLADTNGDEMLDEKEVEAMVHRQAEDLHKQAHGGAVDLAAVAEEAARMREHMMTLMDTDKDQMISLAEFLAEAKSKDFREDKGWKAIVPEEEITDKKLNKFERRRKKVMRGDHKNADPELVKVVSAAVNNMAEKANKHIGRMTKKNPFGKLVEKMGGEKTGWGKIAKEWGNIKNKTKAKLSPKPTEGGKPRRVKVVKDV